MARQKRIGIVVADKLDKTIRVEIESFSSHPLYHKKVRKTKDFLVHDKKNEAKVGDKVEIQETRPLSARKRWQLIKIIERSALTEKERELAEELASEGLERPEPKPKAKIVKEEDDNDSG